MNRHKSFIISMISIAVLLLAGVGRHALTAEVAVNAKDGVNFRFLAIADTHFASHERRAASLQQFKKFLADVKPLGADFAVVLGDVCGEDQPALAQARKVAEDSGLKVHFRAREPRQG